MPPTDGDEELARLRIRPQNVHLAGGFGPLLVGVVLFVVMVLLAPTVAPERVVEEPVNAPTSTTLDLFASSTTAPSASSTSSTATTAAP